MEILIFIFPLLSFLIFQFSDNTKNVKLLYILHTALMSSSFVLSIYLFRKLLDFENDLPLYYYPILKLEKLLIDWSLRLDLFVSGSVKEPYPLKKISCPLSIETDLPKPSLNNASE